MPIVMDLAHTPGVSVRILPHDKGIPNMREKFGPTISAYHPERNLQGIDTDVPWSVSRIY